MKLKYFTLFICSICFSQNENLGTYKDAFGNKIELLENNKFRHTWHFDLAASWTVGKWVVNNDTLKLKIIKVYDTLKVFNKNQNVYKDSLVLAEDEIPKRVTEVENAIKTLSSVGQNKILPNTVFLIRKKKLIVINEVGKLQTERILGFWGNKKYYTWYVKEED
ncbi:hypothetical protein [Flavobacterium nackdongense]|uniref:Uncharacterized protein n=1 Tax=Flavobacterium nackdongense TaxID=2547394 RepID=A0A4P6YBW4_9FLAO|nr:hypothetical protein [Flavobacterium nackdongense]QBN19718.1 hypothetical protein E1750_13195 [Flavobacterium nackdongense]